MRCYVCSDQRRVPCVRTKDTFINFNKYLSVRCGGWCRYASVGSGMESDNRVSRQHHCGRVPRIWRVEDHRHHSPHRGRPQRRKRGDAILPIPLIQPQIVMPTTRVGTSKVWDPMVKYTMTNKVSYLASKVWATFSKRSISKPTLEPKRFQKKEGNSRTRVLKVSWRSALHSSGLPDVM